MNKLYRKGYRLERELVNKFKKHKDCRLSVRTAGSHSPVDVIIIENHQINLIQCKSKREKINMPDTPDLLLIKKWLAYKDKGKWVFEEV